MLAPISNCTGCMACLNACPVSCIENVMDKEGFYYPQIEEKQCIKCGKCTSACPILQESIKKGYDNPEVYAVWHKDEKIIKKSSSGGAFAVFARYILEKGGFVFGAAYDEALCVNHIEVNSLDDLDLLHGSKYVQSNIGDIYRTVKSLLEKGQYVLFSGTPCQVAGLYGFLGHEDYENLLTCDFVCHGVPSPGVFKKYIDYKEEKERSKLIKIEMRTKKRSWVSPFGMSHVYNNGKQKELRNVFKDPYMNGFLYDIFLRNTCYDCPYAKIPRESDITLGDFWGIGIYEPFNHSTKQGISLVLINSKKGQAVFNNCMGEMYFEKRSLEEAKKGNVMLSPRKYNHPSREAFFKDMKTKPFEDLIIKYLQRRPSFKNILIKLIIKLVGIRNINKVKRVIKRYD